MITIICGDPGRGKTALATALGIGNMVGTEAESAVSDCNRLLDGLRKTGFSLLEPPKDHLVYSDYAIHAKVNSGTIAKSKEVEGFRVGLYVNGYDTTVLPPRAIVILDEAHIYYDSKRGTRLPEFVTRLYAMHRHNYYQFILVSQRPVSIDKSIRSLSEEFIYIRGMYNDYDEFGNVVNTEWDCVTFNNTASAEKYSDTKVIDANGILTQYAYEGNIFESYDSHGKFSLFYNGREKSVIANTESKFINWNGDEIRTYNNTHKIETPDIFLKQKKKGNEELEEAV